MDTLITYDIKSDSSGGKDTAVKNGMKALQYKDRFASDKYDNVKKTYYLPNTTLWKAGVTPTQAKSDLLNVAKNCSATVERLFSTEISDSWDAITGLPYAS